MSIASRLLVACALLCAPFAQAQEVEIGTGLICDTPEQAARYVALFDEDADKALKIVNAENKPAACAIKQVAFVRGKEVSRARNKNTSVSIVEIAVIGVATPRGIERRAPIAQFTIFAVEELSA